MKKKITGAVIGFAALCSGATLVQAELWQQTGTAYVNTVAYPQTLVIYDDCLNVSYLDINSGELDWGGAHDFILSVSWVAADGTVYEDWRLPSLRETAVTAANDTDSELGHIFHEELNNISLLDKDECEADAENAECETGLVNTAPFQSLTDENPYWYGDDELATFDTYAPYFDFATGFQAEIAKSSPLYVLPVRDGAVSGFDNLPLPLPRKPSTFGQNKKQVFPNREPLRNGPKKSGGR